MTVRRLSTLVTAAIVVLFLYSGAYFYLDHTDHGRGLTGYDPDAFVLDTSSDLPWLDALLIPARTVEHRVMIDRRVRAYLTQFWYARDPSGHGPKPDFIHVTGDGTCTFSLERFAGSGELAYLPTESCFEHDFEHRGERFFLRLRCSIHGRGWKTVDVTVHSLDSLVGGRGFHSQLTTSPPRPEPFPSRADSVPRLVQTSDGIGFIDPPPLDTPSMFDAFHLPTERLSGFP